MAESNTESGAETRASAPRRTKQVCFTCRAPFESTSVAAPLICPNCVLDSIRGGRRFRPRF